MKKSAAFVVEIAFDHRGHENIRQPIESTSGSPHSDRRMSRTAIEWMRERSATPCLLSQRWNVGQEVIFLDMDTAIIQPQVITEFR